jgi:hypothetical protein
MLGSWKEIAGYLGKGVRTVQRWEREFGLPVRRPNGGQRRIVHASPEELNRWLATHWAQRPAVTAPLNDGKPRAVDVHIEAARELRSAHLQIVDELRHSLNELAKSCQSLALHMTDSEERLRPVFPNLDHQRGNSPRPVGDTPMPLGKR